MPEFIEVLNTWRGSVPDSRAPDMPVDSIEQLNLWKENKLASVTTQQPSSQSKSLNIAEPYEACHMEA
jgi:hypothetical protein